MNNVLSKPVSGPIIALRSGEYFNFLDPGSSKFTIGDLAIGISREPRFSGQFRTDIDHYSVAEHCIYASYLVEQDFAFEALMHDAPEGVLKDISSPLISILPDYKNIKRKCEIAIWNHFYLPPALSNEVKKVDLYLLAVEKKYIMLNKDSWKATDETNIGVLPWRVCPYSTDFGWSPLTAFRRFMKRFEELYPKHIDKLYNE